MEFNMFRYLIFLVIIYNFSNTILHAEEYDSYECTSFKNVAIDMGYTVTRLSIYQLMLKKDAGSFVAEIDKEYCIVTLVSKMSKNSPDKITILQDWNNYKRSYGKGIYTEKYIYFIEKFFTVNAPEELIAMQLVLYEVHADKFYNSIRDMEKTKI
tara:strand:+ start:95 stop:559 length:465 start_codon:yes stop_codon:yes gene_type:complete